MERVLRGEKLYIHCWGGHGRTGTLVAVLLGRLYNLPYTTALRYTQAFHDARVYPQGVRSPQTPVQRAQVRVVSSLDYYYAVYVGTSSVLSSLFLFSSFSYSVFPFKSGVVTRVLCSMGATELCSVCM